jgi:hypothetical protein
MYAAYGLAVLSDSPLDLPEDGPTPFGSIRVRAGAPPEFDAALAESQLDPLQGSWCQYAVLSGGSTYVRWESVGEFLVPADGGEVRYRRFDERNEASFQVYMLGQALSFALINSGLEPLHGTAVVVDGHAVALLGESGAGKSTLASALIDAGFQLLTDDVLMPYDLHGGVYVLPGPARIKLFPDIAASRPAGDEGGAAMNPFTDKLIVPLAPRHVCRRAVRLKAVYVIDAPEPAADAGRVVAGPLAPRHAVMALVRSAFNRYVVGAERLARQLSASVALAERVPVRRLTYPRTLVTLPDVVSVLSVGLVEET